MKIDFKKLIISVGICQLSGVLGALFTFSALQTWYPLLNKPPFTPPAWIFGPAWTILYVLMGISAYLIWMEGTKKTKVREALLLFGLQLLLNFLWSFIFFGLRLPGYAFLEIIALWVSIIAAIISFFGISRKAGFLLLPYLAWVTFAALLNYSVWMLNP